MDYKLAYQILNEFGVINRVVPWNIRTKIVNYCEKNIYSSEWLNDYRDYYWKNAPDIQKESTYSDGIELILKPINGKIKMIMTYNDWHAYSTYSQGPQCRFETILNEVWPEFEGYFLERVRSNAIRQLKQEKEEKYNNEVNARCDQIMYTLIMENVK